MTHRVESDVSSRRRAMATGLLVTAAFYLAGLLAFAPAGLAAWAVARFSHGAVTLNAPAGSLWRGGADSASIRRQGGVATVPHAVWRIRPDVLSGGLDVTLVAGSGAARSRASLFVRPSRVQLRSLESPLPPAALRPLLPGLDMSSLNGSHA